MEIINRKVKKYEIFVSVILPLYNTNNDHLISSIKSILNQDYTNFEFLILDDGSSIPIKIPFNDNRIIFLKNDINIGVAKSLNKLISLSKGKYIFRMDSDDISKRNRISKCISILEKNKNIDILGTAAKNFGSNNRTIINPMSNEGIRSSLIFFNPIIHPTVVFRSSSISSKGILYPSDYLNEDYSLWSKLILNNNINFFNLNNVLLKYRVHKNQITNMKRIKLEDDSLNIKLNILNNYYRLKFNDYENLKLFFNFKRKIPLEKFKDCFIPISKILIKGSFNSNIEYFYFKKNIKFHLIKLYFWNLTNNFSKQLLIYFPYFFYNLLNI
jgi:glycosyltransferase involved in cell wall biosynthesis